MSFQIYGQRYPAWANHPLGWGPALGTIGQYGCIETDFAMILTDTGHGLNPAALDDLLTEKQIFVREPTGTYDLLPDNTLDLLFPGEYQTTHVAGFDAGGIAPAVNSPDTYVIFFISTPSVPTHFVICYSPDASLLADPWIGAVDRLSGYGGVSAVHKTTYVKHLPKPTPIPPPPPPGPPLPVPTPLPMALYTFLTGDDTHPPDQVTTEASAISQAEDWYDQYHADIQVRQGGTDGPVVYQRPSGGS